jgi:hypothetical protein
VAGGGHYIPTAKRNVELFVPNIYKRCEVTVQERH